MSVIMPYLDEIFEADWAQGTPYQVTQTYSPEDMAIITDKAHREPIIPDPPTNRAYISPPPAPIALVGDAVTLWTSPDYAYDALIENINKTRSDFQIYIYQVWEVRVEMYIPLIFALQITDDRLCHMLEGMHKSGISVRILVSKRIYGAGDQSTATKCYTQLYNAGITIKMWGLARVVESESL